MAIDKLDKLRAVKSKLDEKNVYEPIILNDLVHCSYRQSFARTIKHLLENGFPFVLTGRSIFHFKLPSMGPHRAVHLIWKQPVDNEDDCPEQLKLITDMTLNDITVAR